MTGIYRIAEKNIEISTLHREVHTLCSDYLIADSGVDFTVVNTQADIELEREKALKEASLECITPRRYSDGYLETLAVYRRIADKMPSYDTFLFHGSCVAVDGKGYLFTAKSGTGKSTHTHLWCRLLGNRAVMVNDDKPLIRIADDGVSVYGTPWNGKHRRGINIAVPLKALCILEQAAENQIEPVSKNDAYPLLLQQTYKPADADSILKTLSLLDRLVAGVPLWRLHCNMDIEAARIAFDAMNGGIP